MQIDIKDSSYYFPSAEGATAINKVVSDLEERVGLLRSQGKLTDSTLRDYYGERRFEQIAESNALEGSTLSVGETELAVLKGITITGHDPGYSRDAQALATALDELTLLARIDSPTDFDQLLRLHELILSGRPSAGSFRRQEVRIGGSNHRPPRTYADILQQMEAWEAWSKNQVATPTLIRATVLHAWLEHIHPFIDGNGRTGRAITNLEFVRAGYPPIIIRRKDKTRYLDALGRADEGELGDFFELIADRMDDALTDLERAAQRRQGYDVHVQKYRKAQFNRLAVWNAGVHLLFTSLQSHLTDRFADSTAQIELKEFDQLNVDDFIELSEGRSVTRSWAFRIQVHVPGRPSVNRLAWAGFLGHQLRSHLSQQGDSGRPALYWSVPNPNGYPPWTAAGIDSPSGEEMTIRNDRWLILRHGSIRDLSPSDLASQIADDIVDLTIPDPQL